MKATHIPVCAYILSDPEFIESDVVESYPGHYDEEDPGNPNFFELCTALCEREFLKAYKNLETIIDDRPVKSLSIGCDVEGIIEEWSSLLVDRSNSSTGEYVFFAGNKLIYYYLKGYWSSESNGNYCIPGNMKSYISLTLIRLPKQKVFQRTGWGK